MKNFDPLNIELKKQVLVQASAGTGKTYTITSLFTRLVCEGYFVDSILVVTFTEAAAGELKHRIRNKLVFALNLFENINKHKHYENDDFASYLFKGSKHDIAIKKSRIKTAIACFDEASIMTIHSFCLQILKENAFESRTFFNVKLTSDSLSIIREIVLDFTSIEINNLDPFFLTFLTFKKFHTKNFIPILKKVLSRPLIKILPQNILFQDVSQKYKEISLKISNILKHQEQDIINIFLTHKGINKRSYNKNNVKKWIDKAKYDALKSNHIFNMTEKGDSLYKFTCSRLSHKNKKNIDVPKHEFFNLCEKILKLSNILEKNILAIKLKFINFAVKELKKQKENLRIYFFDDLINSLANALEGKQGKILLSQIRKKYLAGLIDEFQDTDQRQYFIFSKIFSNDSLSPFFMIGDPKQAIYGFRGGDIFAYLKACKDAKKRVYTLRENWRSDPLLVNSVNKLFLKKHNPFIFKDIEFYPVQTPESAENRLIKNNKKASSLQILFINSKNQDTNQEQNIDKDKQGFIKKTWLEKNIPLITAQDIAGLLLSNHQLKKEKLLQKIMPQDIAVLVRTNIQAENINKTLGKLGIPSYLLKTSSVFDSKEADDIADFLCAVLEPENLGFLRASLTSNLFGFLGNDIFNLNQDKDSLNKLQELFRSFKDIWEQKSFSIMIQKMFHSNKALSETKDCINQRSLTNYYHIAELISQAELLNHFSPILLLKWFINQQIPEMREEYSDELRLKSDQKGVAIVTIHKSKGLEYPIVYLPYMWEGNSNLLKQDYAFFHDHNNMETLDLGSEKKEFSKKQALLEEQAENTRILYVAITRAASFCKIFWGCFKSVENSALGKILHNNGDFSEKIMMNDIRQLQQQTNNNITLEIYEPLTNSLFLDNLNKKKEKLKNKKFTMDIVQDWRFSSFSQISAAPEISTIKNTMKNDFFDKTNNINLLDKEIKNLSGLNSNITLIDFPKGADAGDFFHNIFENLDFQAKEDEIINVIEFNLIKFGFKKDKWINYIKKAVLEIINTQFLKDYSDFSLRQIKNNYRFNEMEFLFPFKSISKQVFANVFKKYMNNPVADIYAQKILNLELNSFKGYMKGFIDLVFRFKNKWYIVDYKSNFLGNIYKDYSIDNINSAMMEHHYFLQYHIYVIALHKYLKFRIKDYNYNTDFGGVLYLFIRGMHPKCEKDFGIFYDKPSFALIEKLLQTFDK